MKTEISIIFGIVEQVVGDTNKITKNNMQKIRYSSKQVERNSAEGLPGANQLLIDPSKKTSSQ